MKRLALVLALTACGTDSKETAATLVAPETTTTATATSEETTENKEATIEPDAEPEINPDAYPIPEGYTRIQDGAYTVESAAWLIKFKVDFQCSGGIEIRGEYISTFGWMAVRTEKFDSQPTSWVAGYQVNPLPYTAAHEEHEVTIPKTYNLHNRVLYKCL